MGSSSSRVTQRWAQPKSPNSHADALHSSDSHHLSAPFLIVLPGGWGPPPTPDPICVALPRAAAEGWTRLRGLAAPEGPSRSTGHRLHWKRSSTAALSFQSGKKCHAKGCSPLALLCRSLNWSFSLFGTFSARLFVELLASRLLTSHVTTSHVSCSQKRARTVLHNQNS